MLWSTAYLESRLPSPLPTKDGGNLYAVKDVRAYVLGLAHSRSGHLYWRRAHQLLLDQADVVTLRRQVCYLHTSKPVDQSTASEFFTGD